MKLRRGGVLTREFEQRVLDGDTRAMRPLLRQAQGVNIFDPTGTNMQMRAAANGTGGTRLQFEGYASVVEAPFTMSDWLGDYTEIVRAGAFTKALAADPNVTLCLNHVWDGVPLARTVVKAGMPATMQLSEDSTGLLTYAQLDGNRADVYAIQSAMEAGELDAMSFAFWVTKQAWSPDYDQRDILEVDLDQGDTSIVTWPANPATWGTTSLHSAQVRSVLRTRVPGLIAERAREEIRAGKALSAATMETLQEVLDLIATADVAVDSAQPLLAELMGVPNPDDDGEAPDEPDADDETTEGETKSAHGNADLVRERLALLARTA